MTDPHASYDRRAPQAREHAPEPAQVIEVELTDDEYTLSVRDAQGNVVDTVAGLLPADIPAAEFLRQQGVQVNAGTWEFAQLARGADSVGGWRALGTTTSSWEAVAERVAAQRGVATAMTAAELNGAQGRGGASSRVSSRWSIVTARYWSPSRQPMQSRPGPQAYCAPPRNTTRRSNTPPGLRSTSITRWPQTHTRPTTKPGLRSRPTTTIGLPQPRDVEPTTRRRRRPRTIGREHRPAPRGP